MTMKELAKRCEQATGPDRVLDADIAEVVDAPAADDPDRNLTIHRQIIAKLRAGGDDCEIERYTASLDAAMTLVPEGRGLIYKRHGIKNVWRVQIHSGDETTFIEGDAATPALALCAAALKARASQETTR
jgi:hypothetical protein